MNVGGKFTEPRWEKERGFSLFAGAGLVALLDRDLDHHAVVVTEVADQVAEVLGGGQGGEDAAGDLRVGEVDLRGHVDLVADGHHVHVAELLDVRCDLVDCLDGFVVPLVVLLVAVVAGRGHDVADRARSRGEACVADVPTMDQIVELGPAVVSQGVQSHLGGILHFPFLFLYGFLTRCEVLTPHWLIQTSFLYIEL